MTGVAYALYGLLGGFLVEAVELRRAIHTTKTWPWKDPSEPSFGPWLAAVLLRLAASTGLAFGVGAGGQISGPFGALTAGIAAPLMIEKLARQLPGGVPSPEQLAVSTPAQPHRLAEPLVPAEPQAVEPAGMAAQAEAQS